MPDAKLFSEVFTDLKNILKKYEKNLAVAQDTDSLYSLNGPYSERFKKDLWFGGVEIKKNYVGFHLMPVYMYNELSEKVPANLKKRMQGKSCFNFKKVDKDLFSELERFVDMCYKEFLNRGEDIS